MVTAFWIGQFIFSWVAWFLFAKKGRWHKYLPVCIFASWLSLILEALMHYYNLWSYSGHPLIALFGNAFGIYIVTLYLFIQWLPEDRSLRPMLIYWFKWSIVVIIFEWFHFWLGHISYHKWWNIGYSYISDWLLLWIFYRYHIFITKNNNCNY